MRKHFEIISAATALSMLLGCGTYIKPVYAEESIIPDADSAPIDEVTRADNGVTVSVKEDGEVTSNSINPTFTITNTSDKEMNLEDLKLKYYYTADGEQDQTFNCYYAGTVDGNYRALTSYVQGKIAKMDKATEGADSYMEVTFNGGTLDAGQSAMIQTSVNKNDWSNYDKGNDYSYDNAANIEVSIKGVPDTHPSEEVKPEAMLNACSASYDKKDAGDIKIGKNDKANLFSGIEGLVQGEDYILEDENTIVLKESYLQKLPEGENSIFLEFGSMKYEFKINVSDTREKTLNITSDEVIGCTGETITIPVNISGLSKENDLCGGVFKLQYDTDLLEDVTISAGPICPQKTFSRSINKTTGVISIFFADDTAEGLDDITEDGVFFTIKARVKDNAQPGNYKLKVYDEGSFSDKDYNDYTLKFNLENIYVSPGPIRKNVDIATESICAGSGDTITVPVKFDTLGLTGINKCDFKFKYDTDIFENVSVSAGEMCPNAENTFSSNVDSSTGIISGKFSGGSEDNDKWISSNDGVFMYITLKVKDNIDSVDTNLKEESGEVSSVHYGECYPSYNLGKITINNSKYGDEDVSVEYEDVEGKAGKIITVPINIRFDTNKHSLPAAQIVLSYDKDIFENVDAEAGEICKSPQENFYCNKDEDKGTLNIMYMASDLEGGSEYIYNNGVLAYVRLKIKADCSASETQLKADFSTFTDADLKVISSEFYPGKITIAKQAKKPEVSIKDNVFNTYLPKDMDFTMNLNGDEFVGIKGLSNKYDYTVSDNIVTLDKNFLKSLELGEHKLDFMFSSGEIVEVSIWVQSIYYSVAITSDNTKCFPGELISIPVKVSGLSKYNDKLAQCLLRLEYDTDVLEDITITPGDICSNEDNFATAVYPDKGEMCACYICVDDPADYITEDGVFITISATVKDDAAIGKHEFEVHNQTCCINEDYSKDSIGFDLGYINVTPIPIP